MIAASFTLTRLQLPEDALEGLSGEEFEAVARVVRIASGVATPADSAIVHAAAKAWLESNGDVPFERCLRLPTTPDAFRRMQRDVWLCDAAKHVDGPSDWEVSTRLYAEWERFLSRGPWRDWRDDPEPPDWATAIERALFYASRLNRGNSLSERQLNRITGQFFRKKCQ